VHLRELVFSRASLIFSVPMLLVFVVGVWQMQTATPVYPLRTKLFPLLVAIPMLFIALYQVGVELGGKRRKQAEPSPATGEDGLILEGSAAPTPEQLRQGLLWFAAFFVAVWALGFMVAIPLFTFTYFVLAGGDRWYWGVVAALISIGFLWGMFDQWLHIPLLRGQIFTALGIG
jgi:hypothetical protein